MSERVADRRLPVHPRRVAGQTKRALALAAGRRDGTAAFGIGTLLYLVVYLVATGSLAIRRGLGVDLVVANDPVGKLLKRTGPVSFEPIALVDVYVARLLVAPGDILIGLTLAVLVGANLALTYLAVVQPKACGIETGTGVLAAVPALLSGTACCGPVILLSVGVTASGAIIAIFAWLVPLGALALLGSLAYVATQIAV